MLATAVTAEVVSAIARRRNVKLIYGILGSPGANIFHLDFKGDLPLVSHDGTVKPPTPKVLWGFTTSAVAL